MDRSRRPDGWPPAGLGPTTFAIHELSDGGSAVLAALPAWFGIPEAVDAYVAAVERLPMLVARDPDGIAGFVSLKARTAVCSELYVLGTLPACHRRGLGAGCSKPLPPRREPQARGT